MILGALEKHTGLFFAADVVKEVAAAAKQESSTTTEPSSTEGATPTSTATGSIASAVRTDTVLLLLGKVLERAVSVDVAGSETPDSNGTDEREDEEPTDGAHEASKETGDADAAGESETKESESDAAARKTKGGPKSISAQSFTNCFCSWGGKIPGRKPKFAPIQHHINRVDYFTT